MSPIGHGWNHRIGSSLIAGNSDVSFCRRLYKLPRNGFCHEMGIHCFQYCRRARASVLNLGCTGVEDTEDLLLQAGFTIGIMTDAQKQQLKPYKVTVAKENGETSYFYADPA